TVTLPSQATLLLNADGSMAYTPPPGYVGPDGFTYTLTDTLANTDVAVTINVTNYAPTANSDAYGVQSGTALIVPARQGLLANDVDAEGDHVTASLVSGSGPFHGSLALNADGSFTYTPAAGYSGADTFAYAASDGVVQGTVSVSLFVHPVNSAPSANNAG